MSCSLMLDVEGLTLTGREKEMLKQDSVGGVILFARNYENRQQLKELILDIRHQTPDIIIAVDQEGGRVQRFRDGFVRLPPMSALNHAYLNAPSLAKQQATEIGWLMAYEITQFDIDISFAPVLDLNWRHSQVIGDRSFGACQKQVIELTKCFVEGMNQAGMKSTGKHFPGHGWATADSHLDITVDERDYDSISKDDLQPFKALINAGLDGIMPAHVIFEKVDSQPAGFSKYWLQDILRKELSFNGVIFSDDLNMNGANIADADDTNRYSSRAKAAMEAGCDTLLLCNNPTGAKEVLDFLTSEKIPVSKCLASMRRSEVEKNDQRLSSASKIASELIQQYGEIVSN